MSPEAPLSNTPTQRIERLITYARARHDVMRGSIDFALHPGVHGRAGQAHGYSTLLESEMEEELPEDLGKSWRAQEIVNLKYSSF